MCLFWKIKKFLILRRYTRLFLRIRQKRLMPTNSKSHRVCLWGIGSTPFVLSANANTQRCASFPFWVIGVLRKLLRATLRFCIYIRLNGTALFLIKTKHLLPQPLISGGFVHRTGKQDKVYARVKDTTFPFLYEFLRI